MVPLRMNARSSAIVMSTHVYARPVKSGLRHLHEFSQSRLHAKSIKAKKAHHHGQRPGDPFSLHHARPFFVMNYEEDNINLWLPASNNSDTPIYIGNLHPSDHISRIFHPPTV